MADFIEFVNTDGEQKLVAVSEIMAVERVRNGYGDIKLKNGSFHRTTKTYEEIRNALVRRTTD